MQAIALTVFSWLSHFSQCYILLKCNNSEKEECINGLEDDDIEMVDYYTGTSISESMVFPTCVNYQPNRYDFLAFTSIHLVFTKFIYMMYYIYSNPGIIFHNQTIETLTMRNHIRLARFGIILSSIGIYMMYFTTYTNNPIKSVPSDVRSVLTDMHMFCVILIVLGTGVLCYQIVREIDQKMYTFLSYGYFLAISILGSVFLYKYVNNSLNDAMRFMNIGEWEIFYFTYVYYLLSIITYLDGNIHNTMGENKWGFLGIAILNFIIGPTCYSCINCLL